ncbi:MAG: hypothetical protein N4A54_05870 [Peptostreptococcaceae bacterium]|jgi:hypothetical protein|nr:hypothetical protein [Peptostreptococcaceae bacterium]
MNQLINSDLLLNETILWSDQPNFKLFESEDILLIPFSFFWCSFIAFWEYQVLNFPSMGHFNFMALFGIPFILVGIYLLIGRFFYKAYIYKNRYYYVTDKRIIILTNTNYQNIESKYISQIPTINKKVRMDGSGTLIFGNNYRSNYRSNRRSHQELTPSFHNITDANKVYRIVNEIRNSTLDA